MANFAKANFAKANFAKANKDGLCEECGGC
jgi:uncharacterized protein YjbI with pentapeptide repeats